MAASDFNAPGAMVPKSRVCCSKATSFPADIKTPTVCADGQPIPWGTPGSTGTAPHRDDDRATGWEALGMTKDAAPPAGFRALLRNRDYRLLFAGLSISLSGSWAYNVGLVVFVFNATHSAGWVAVASITRFLTALVTSPFGGLIADRVERVRLMVTLDVLSLILQSLLALVAALNGSVILAIIVTAFAAATGSAYDRPLGGDPGSRRRGTSALRTARNPRWRTWPSSSAPESARWSCCLAPRAWCSPSTPQPLGFRLCW